MNVIRQKISLLNQYESIAARARSDSSCKGGTPASQTAAMIKGGETVIQECAKIANAPKQDTSKNIPTPQHDHGDPRNVPTPHPQAGLPYNTVKPGSPIVVPVVPGSPGATTSVPRRNGEDVTPPASTAKGGHDSRGGWIAPADKDGNILMRQ
jgi:hypothetical protein